MGRQGEVRPPIISYDLSPSINCIKHLWQSHPSPSQRETGKFREAFQTLTVWMVIIFQFIQNTKPVFLQVKIMVKGANRLQLNNWSCIQLKKLGEGLTQVILPLFHWPEEKTDANSCWNKPYSTCVNRTQIMNTFSCESGPLGFSPCKQSPYIYSMCDNYLKVSLNSKKALLLPKLDPCGHVSGMSKAMRPVNSKKENSAFPAHILSQHLIRTLSDHQRPSHNGKVIFSTLPFSPGTWS